MDQILNEVKYINRILNERYVDPKTYNSLRILAKYYAIKGLKKKEIHNEVFKYACKHYLKTQEKGGVNKKYEMDELEKVVTKYVNSLTSQKKKLEKGGKVFKLYGIESISITKNELYKISMLSNHELERLAYVMLVLSKIAKAKSDYLDGVYSIYCNSDVFKESFLSYSYKNKCLINEMKQTGHVQPNEEYGNSRLVKLLYADNDNDSEIAITIIDFRNFAYTYDQYRGSKMIKNCSGCNVLFEKRSSTHKYCDACKRENELQKTRKRVMRYKNKKVTVRESEENP
ncbi:hypothetical protein [Brevibacillus sp. NRS-1366]|uniref:hypothetical protein n=1 Tax=Brevibacillus sp. NRS-1366 TaxID=3233899 RepID=UPI003D23E7A8